MHVPSPTEKVDLYTHKIQITKKPANHLKFNLASWILADAKYIVDHGEESYFKSPMKKSKLIESAKEFCRKFHVSDEKVKLGYTEELDGWYGKVGSFDGNKPPPYSVKLMRETSWDGPFSFLKNAPYVCNCPSSMSSKIDSEIEVDKHSKILADLLADLELISRRGIFGSDSRAFRESAEVINEIARSDSYGSSDPYYKINKNRPGRATKIIQIIGTYFWRDRIFD